MGIFGRFAEAITSAWAYVESSVTRGLSAIEGVTQYISGGGDIEEEAFATAHASRREAEDVWRGIQNIPRTYRVTESFSFSSPFDWNQKYIMKMKAEFTDYATGEKSTSWITVESDTELTRAEWEDEAQQALLTLPTTLPKWIDSIEEWQYYTKEEREYY